jgi:hypothetical protein
MDALYVYVFILCLCYPVFSLRRPDHLSKESYRL